MQTISFEPTRADLIAASRVHFWASLKSWRMLRGYFLGAATCAVAAPLFVWGGDTLELIAAAIGGALFWSLILMLILLLNYILVPARSRRMFAQQKALQCAVVVKWADEGISLESDRGSSNFAWTDFVGCAQSSDVILLLQSDYLFNFIPKRSLSEAQATSIMACCKGVRLSS